MGGRTSILARLGTKFVNCFETNTCARAAASSMASSSEAATMWSCSRSSSASACCTRSSSPICESSHAAHASLSAPSGRCSCLPLRARRGRGAIASMSGGPSVVVNTERAKVVLSCTAAVASSISPISSSLASACSTRASFSSARASLSSAPAPSSEAFATRCIRRRICVAAVPAPCSSGSSSRSVPNASCIYGSRASNASFSCERAAEASPARAAPTAATIGWSRSTAASSSSRSCRNSALDCSRCSEPASNGTKPTTLCARRSSSLASCLPTAGSAAPKDAASARDAPSKSARSRHPIPAECRMRTSAGVRFHRPCAVSRRRRHIQ
mmetsp:Transcript_11129/g.46302  ORF Transcript_11129/g.46302 Transcript_11129/m.46302 type:complete len:328 (-) Transcript_11129:218-1201(-)